MAKIAPIRPSKRHVDIEDGHAEAEVVLIEHAFELFVQKDFALGKPQPSPGIERSSLELRDRVRSGRTLLLVKDMPVCR